MWVEPVLSVPLATGCVVLIPLPNTPLFSIYSTFNVTLQQFSCMTAKGFCAADAVNGHNGLLI